MRAGLRERASGGVEHVLAMLVCGKLRSGTCGGSAPGNVRYGGWRAQNLRASPRFSAHYEMLAGGLRPPAVGGIMRSNRTPAAAPSHNRGKMAIGIQ